MSVLRQDHRGEEKHLGAGSGRTVTVLVSLTLSYWEDGDAHLGAAITLHPT